MTTYAQQIAEAVREAAAKAVLAKVRHDPDVMELRAEIEQRDRYNGALSQCADAIRALDLDAIIASAPVPAEQPEAAQDELTEAADLVVIANATGNPDLYHDAVAALLKVVRQAAKRDALTQASQKPLNLCAVWDAIGEYAETHHEFMRRTPPENGTYQAHEKARTELIALIGERPDVDSPTPSKPSRCANGCPPFTICDFCQGPKGKDRDPVAQARELTDAEIWQMAVDHGVEFSKGRPILMFARSLLSASKGGGK